jgi:Flp pilus assembly protein TadD
MALLQPMNFEAFYNAGLMFELAGRARDARRMFVDAAVLRPNDPSTQWHIGVAAFHLGMLRDAEHAFRIAAALAPNDPSAWSYLGATIARSHRYEEALSYWRRAVAIDSLYLRRAAPIERALYARSARRMSRQRSTELQR